MKISIVTVYNSENCGSYWQSYALMKVLENMGHEVTFYKRPVLGSSHSWVLLLARTLKWGIRFQRNKIVGMWRQYIAFSRMHANFKVSKKTPQVYVLGSDTLWAVENPYFKRNIDLYTGSLFADKMSFTYAISAGNASEDQFWNIPHMSEKLKKLTAISVRDSHTKHLVESGGAFMVCQVLDPTLLLDSAEYEEMMGEKPSFSYILIYIFSELSDREKKAIEQFARLKGLQIIFYGKYMSGNTYIYAEPISFITYMKYADFIITDTFHGTIFSMLFHKKFVVLDRNKKKVYDLMQQFGMEKQILKTVDSFESVIISEIDYIGYEKIRNDCRKQSMEYIKEALCNRQVDGIEDKKQCQE